MAASAELHSPLSPTSFDENTLFVPPTDGFPTSDEFVATPIASVPPAPSNTATRVSISEDSSSPKSPSPRSSSPVPHPLSLRTLCNLAPRDVYEAPDFLLLRVHSRIPLAIRGALPSFHHRTRLAVIYDLLALRDALSERRLQGLSALIFILVVADHQLLVHHSASRPSQPPLEFFHSAYQADPAPSEIPARYKLAHPSSFIVNSPCQEHTLHIASLVAEWRRVIDSRVKILPILPYAHAFPEPDLRKQTDFFRPLPDCESPRPSSPVLSERTPAEVSFSEDQLSRHIPHLTASNFGHDSSDFSSSVQTFMRSSRGLAQTAAASERFPSRSGSLASSRSLAAWAFPDRQKRHTRSNLHEGQRNTTSRISLSCFADLRSHCAQLYQQPSANRTNVNHSTKRNHANGNRYSRPIRRPFSIRRSPDPPQHSASRVD